MNTLIARQLQANCSCTPNFARSHAVDCIWTVMTEAVETMQALFDHIVLLEHRVHGLEAAR